MNFEEYRRHDAVGLAALVKKKEVTPEELLELAVARMDAVNPRLNAIVHVCFDRARERWKREEAGALWGVPFLVKDLDGMLAGEPFTASCRSYLGYVPEQDSTLFERYEAAGLGIFAKTNTPEFGLFAVTESALRGPCRNPWNLAHTPGGSSGGSAAAVAAGIVPVAHGGDGGGSIRIPASCCGLFGLKPTRGRMPLGPEAGEGWNGFVVPHVLSRSVRDSALMLDLSHGEDLGAPYASPLAPARGFLHAAQTPPKALRIGVVSYSLFGENTHSDCSAALQHSVKLCTELGHETEEVLSLPFSREALTHAYLVVVCAGTAQAVQQAAAWKHATPKAEEYEPETWFLSQVGHALSAYDLEKARQTFQLATRSLAKATAHVDLLLTPTLAYPPARIGELAAREWERAGLALLRVASNRWLLEGVIRTMAMRSFEKTPNTMLFNMTGQPAMSVPLYWNPSGLPIGTQFVGRYGDEATLLSLASQLEQAQPWFARLPTL